MPDMTEELGGKTIVSFLLKKVYAIEKKKYFLSENSSWNLRLMNWGHEIIYLAQKKKTAKTMRLFRIRNGEKYISNYKDIILNL